MPRRPRKESPSVPSTIGRSEKHAQHLWKKAHDSAVWKGPSDPQAAQGARDKPKPTARGKVARTESEARRKAEQARKEQARIYRRRRRKTTRTKSAQRKK